MRSLLALGLSCLGLFSACSSSSDTPADTGGAAGTAGTGGAGAQPPRWTSGKRLRANVVVATDAPPELVGVRDIDRKEDCVFRGVADGKYRCVPKVEGPPAEQYADDACTQPFVYLPSCAAAPSAVSRTAPSACGSSVTGVRTVGAKVTVGLVHKKDASGACIGSVTTTPSGVDAYLLGADIPLESFVAATVTSETRAAPFSLDTLVGEDGSKMPLALRDSTVGEPVFHATASDGTERWFPAGGALSNASSPFSDATCSVRAALSLCASSKYALRSPDAACNAHKLDLFKAGAALTTLYSKPSMSASCASFPVSPGDTYIALGDAVAPTTLTATKLVPAGKGRVTTTQPVDASGAVLASGSFTDTSIKGGCTPTTAADGKVRCFPAASAAVIDSTFLDASCAIPLARFASSCGEPAPTVAIAVDTSNACASTSRALTVGAAMSPTTVYLKVSGMCAMAPFTLEAGVTYFTTGAEISDLPELTQQTE